MKTQLSKQYDEAFAPKIHTPFQKNDRMARQTPTTLTLVLVMAVLIATALSAEAGEMLYMVTQNNVCGTTPTCDTNTLVSVDLGSLANGLFTATTKGPTTLQGSGGQTAEIRGLAYDNNNHTMYGITAQGVLATVNLHTGATAPVYTLQGYAQNEWSGLVFDGTSTFYAVNAFGNQMVAINPFNHTATVVGNTNYLNSPQQILGLASSGGVLYGSDRTIDNLVTINSDASVNLPHSFTSGVNNLQEIAIDPSGKFYAVFDHVATSNNAGLAAYDFTTGTATALGELPFEIDFNGCQGCGNGTYGAGGFAFAPTPEPGSFFFWAPA